MAELKRKNLVFQNGKQLKLYGNSFSISRNLEIGEGAVPHIFCEGQDMISGKNNAVVKNPFQLSQDELMELADYNIQLWMDFKSNLRRFGIDNPNLFNSDGAK